MAPQMYHVAVTDPGTQASAVRTVVAVSPAKATAIALERERAAKGIPTNVQLFAAATLVVAEVGATVRVA